MRCTTWTCESGIPFVSVIVRARSLVPQHEAAACTLHYLVLYLTISYSILLLAEVVYLIPYYLLLYRLIYGALHLVEEISYYTRAF